jgi:hypothetical protein
MLSARRTRDAGEGNLAIGKLPDSRVRLSLRARR